MTGLNESEKIVYDALRFYAGHCSLSAFYNASLPAKANEQVKTADLATQFADELQKGELKLVVVTKVLGDIKRFDVV